MKKFDVTIQRSGFNPVTTVDLERRLVDAYVVDVLDVAFAALDAGDAESKVSVSIRPAKETVYEVWCSADVGEIKETTFSHFDNAKTHADQLWEQERARYEKGDKHLSDDQIGYLRHYYVKQRRGRAKGTVVYRAYPQ